MNFDPKVRAWLQLLCLVISGGGAVALTSFLGGSSMPVALIAGLITAATNVGHALAASPKEKAEELASRAPFPVNPPPPRSNL